MQLFARSVCRIIIFGSLLGGVVFGQDAKLRTWSDISGKFKVRAALHQQNERLVVLHTEDGRSVEVPIDRLSQSDRDFLLSLSTSADNPFEGGKPVGEMLNSSPVTPGTLDALPPSTSVGAVMALPGVGRTIDLSIGDSLESFAPDPLGPPAELPEAVVAVTEVDAYDKVSAPVFVGEQAGLFLVSVGRNKSGKPEETRGRLFVVDLSGGRSNSVWDKPAAIRVLDHHPSSGRTLIVDQLDQFERAGELVVLEGVAEGSPTTLFRRSLPGLGKPGFQPMVEWARMLSASHAAAIVDGALLVWDLPAAQLLYRIDKVKASEPPAFSGNLRYMAVPQGGKVVVVETATGRVGKSFSTGSTLTPGVSFHPNGRLVAACFSNQYMVWDCVEDTIVSEAVTTAQLGSSPVAWVGDRMFRTSLGSMVDPSLGMPVWSYHIASASPPLVIGNRMLTTTRSPLAKLCSLPIPHEAAKEGMKRLLGAGDEAMLVRSGSKVAIAIEGVSGSDEKEIQVAPSNAATKAGWTVTTRAPIQLVAKIGRGETQELHYRSMHGPMNKSSTASLTPFTADLEIRDASSVLWRRSSTNHVPRLLRLEEGETVQDAVKRYEKPDPGFFARLNLPPRIPKSEFVDQIGMSSLKDGKWMDISAEIRNRSRRSR